MGKGAYPSGWQGYPGQNGGRGSGVDGITNQMESLAASTPPPAAAPRKSQGLLIIDPTDGKVTPPQKDIPHCSLPQLPL